jgi:hypothetical protein
VSTRAVHIFQFSKASNHVSCRYRQSSELAPVRAADEPFRFMRNDPLRRAGLQSIGALSSLDVGDPTEPLTPRRRPRPPGPRALLPVGSSPLSPSSHDRRRLPRTRTPSTAETPLGARPTRTVRSASEHRRSSRAVSLRIPSLAGFHSRGFHRRKLPRQASLNSFCSFSMNTTRDHIRGFRSPHALSRQGDEPRRIRPLECRLMRSRVSRRQPCPISPAFPDTIRRPTALPRPRIEVPRSRQSNQDPALQRIPRRTRLGHGPGAFHHRPRA